MSIPPSASPDGIPHLAGLRVIATFPELGALVPRDARHFSLVVGACLMEGATTFDEEVTTSIMLLGGVQRGAALAADGFLAGIRSRQSEELVVVLQRGDRSFVFLERFASPWVEALPETKRALLEARARWQRGEDVRYVHGFGV